MKNENRLKKRKHFNYIYKNGDARFSANIKLVFIKSKKKPYKVGFSVSKKIGKSVVRSKVKRRLKESFREHSPFVKQNYNYIFVAKSGIENIEYTDIKKEIKSLLIKADCYDEKFS